MAAMLLTCSARCGGVLDWQAAAARGSWGMVSCGENSLILQCSDDSSSLVLRGNVTRQTGSVSTRNNILKFRILNLLFYYLNVTLTRPALSCVTDFLIISCHAVVSLHINYAPFTDYFLCTGLCSLCYTCLQLWLVDLQHRASVRYKPVLYFAYKNW